MTEAIEKNLDDIVTNINDNLSKSLKDNLLPIILQVRDATSSLDIINNLLKNLPEYMELQKKYDELLIENERLKSIIHTHTNIGETTNNTLSRKEEHLNIDNIKSEVKSEIGEKLSEAIGIIITEQDTKVKTSINGLYREIAFDVKADNLVNPSLENYTNDESSDYEITEDESSEEESNEDVEIGTEHNDALKVIKLDEKDEEKVEEDEEKVEEEDDQEEGEEDEGDREEVKEEEGEEEEEEDEEEEKEEEEEEEGEEEEEEEGEEEEGEEEEEEEVYELTIKGKAYFVTNETNGDIYASDNGDPGDIVGAYKNGKITWVN